MNAFTIPARSAMLNAKAPTTYTNPDQKHPGKTIYISSRDDRKMDKGAREWESAKFDGVTKSMKRRKK